MCNYDEEWKPSEVEMERLSEEVLKVLMANETYQKIGRQVAQIADRVV